mgnify:CR=1 FL=1
MLRNAQPTRRSRSGVLSMELVLTLPILLILLFGLLEFSLLFFARGDVVDASRAGGRAAETAVVRQQRRADQTVAAQHQGATALPGCHVTAGSASASS